jgi:protein-tyrosine-phosphatase
MDPNNVVVTTPTGGRRPIPVEDLRDEKKSRFIFLYMQSRIDRLEEELDILRSRKAEDQNKRARSSREFPVLVDRILEMQEELREELEEMRKEMRLLRQAHSSGLGRITEEVAVQTDVPLPAARVPDKDSSSRGFKEVPLRQ